MLGEWMDLVALVIPLVSSVSSVSKSMTNLALKLQLRLIP